MASAATTPNLGLPQWVTGEKPERADFNAAKMVAGGYTLAIDSGGIYGQKTGLKTYLFT